jgi:capsular polysaccharide transport system ATP-binding protein
MIRLENISKYYKMRTGIHSVLNRVNLEIKKGEKIGILGTNGAGKSTLVRILSGALIPNQGRIIKQMSISWPIAFSGGFQQSLTGIDNIKFLCRIYDKSTTETISFIESFAELGLFLYEPIKNYSSGMRARLAFAASMAINFECFLIDEVIAVGDIRFQEKCKKELFINRAEHSLVLVSHNEQLIRQYCQKGYVLHKGTLHDFDSLDMAFSFYKSNL